METLKKSFPQGMDYKIIYDPTQFVRQSIDAVDRDAARSRRCSSCSSSSCSCRPGARRSSRWSRCPCPSSARSRCCYALGFSINTLSLFGLVLAIGIVVDDSIVVVENVERHIANGLKPLEATKKAMSEVSRPIIAITLVLVRGVHSGRLRRRPHGRVLSPVRADHRHLDGDLRVQLADAVAGARRRAAEAARRQARRAHARHRQGVRPLLRALQQAVRPRE